MCRGGAILEGTLPFLPPCYFFFFLRVFFFISNYLILEKYCNNYFEF